MEIGTQLYWNTVCTFCRCFDLSLSLSRLFEDGKTLGVLKLGFFTETFATKRLFVRIQRGFFVYAGGFRFLFKKYSERDGRR